MKVTGWRGSSGGGVDSVSQIASHTVPEKLRYEIDLSSPRPAPDPGMWLVRPVSPDDLHGLARLMLDAYRGTIDYEDETLDDAEAEVRSFFEDASAKPERSYVVEDEGDLVSAILVLVDETSPFIGYVMTTASHKNRGLASLVTSTALDHLRRDGHEKVILYITEGNTASEALFRSLGATRG